MADPVNIFKSDIRGIIHKEVDFIPGAYVDFYDSPTIGAIKKAQQAQTTQDIDLSLGVILNQIADWNFADENGILTVNMENLEKLPFKLLTWIAETQGAIIQDQATAKKK